MGEEKKAEKIYFTASEFDQAGNNVANYIELPAQKGGHQIDVIVSSYI